MLSDLVAKKPMNILILEDHPDLRISLCTLLEFHDYTVFSGANGLDGLHLMQQHTPDIIISDLKMPYMDGLEFYKTICQNEAWKDVPFVLLTGQSDVVDPDAMIYVENVLAKPICIESLITLLAELGGDVQATTQSP